MSDQRITFINDELRRCADPQKAEGMQAYMKTEQPFLGVSAPQRRKIARTAMKNFPFETRADYEAAVRRYWTGRYREEMYMALELATGRKKWVTEDSLPLYIELVRSAGWWDTLDWIAAHLISPLLRQNRQLEALLIEWRRDEGMWVRRAALLSQLNHKTAVNRELLAETILLLSGEKEFFIRKAIGWVLRDVSYSFPDWVAAFVETHHDALSGLSRREAMKAIDRARTQNPSAD